jgi:hypothetical protein
MLFLLQVIILSSLGTVFPEPQNVKNFFYVIKLRTLSLLSISLRDFIIFEDYILVGPFSSLIDKIMQFSPLAC